MKSNCVFTICAKNYTGLARILEKSVHKYNGEDTDFFIIIADEPTSDTPDLGGNVIIAKDALGIPAELWTNMTFKYNLTEFCTAIKPYTFSYMFARGYENVVYMDPDTYLFSSLDYVYDKLKDFLVVTTPHILLPQYPYDGDLSDTSFLFNGINNFGFVAMRRSPKTIHIVKWWEDRLARLCFGENLWALCVDQKWMDYLQAFLRHDELFVAPNMGMNLAPWNYFERRVVREPDGYYVVNRSGESLHHDKLIFAHFAGYNYREFVTTGKVNNKARVRINTLREYPDIDVLLQEYITRVWEDRDLFNRYLSQPYTYGTFDNGVKIEKMHRRLYNGLCNNFQYAADPFKTAGQDSYYNMLQSKRLFGKPEAGGKGVDSMQPGNIGGFENKLKWLYKGMRLFYRMVGYKNYILFLQFMQRLSIYDINTYLLGKNYENRTLR